MESLRWYIGKECEVCVDGYFRPMGTNRTTQKRIGGWIGVCWSLSLSLLSSSSSSSSATVILDTMLPSALGDQNEENGLGSVGSGLGMAESQVSAPKRRRKAEDEGGGGGGAEPRRLRRSHEACARCRSKKIKASADGKFLSQQKKRRIYLFV